MLGAAVTFVTWILGLIFKRPPGPSQEAQAAKAAGEATVGQTVEGQAVNELQVAAAARADADAERVRSDPDANRVTTDPAAPINTNPDGHFRD